MIAENQQLNEELQRNAREGERRGEEARRAEARAAQLQAAVDAGGEEREEMLRSYRKQVRALVHGGPPLLSPSLGLPCTHTCHTCTSFANSHVTCLVWQLSQLV